MDNTDQMFARAMRILALVTFLSATAIFMLCYFFAGKFLLLGLGFVVVAALVNLSLFSITLSMGIKQRNKDLLYSAAALIMNAPVIAVYIWFTV
jgi:hypothetical protein